MLIVTGASRGLGRAICDYFHAAGESVLGLSRHATEMSFESVACDVADCVGLRDVAADLRQRKVMVTGLVNAAGIASMNLAVTTPASVTRRLVEVNLLGTIYSCQAFAPLMMRQRRGAIINFSTIAVPLALKGESIYAAAKAGVEAFSRSFAREMADFDIRVNCVAPGPIRTDLLRGVTEQQIDEIVERQIIQREFEPGAVVNTVEMLLSDKANAITGQTIHVGGV